jgi:hypothetical protein
MSKVFGPGGVDEMVVAYYKTRRTERLGQYAINHYLRVWNPKLVDPELFYEEDPLKALWIINERYQDIQA